MSIRFYGPGPYRVAVVHGGPGAPGSVAGLARGISKCCNVMEPMQSKRTIEALIEELKSQIEQFCDTPVVLIGHSWGAWLAGLTAARFPALISRLVLIACGPLEVKYVQEIGKRRESNMSPEDYAAYKELLSCLNDEDTPEKDKKLARLGAIAGKADQYDEVDDAELPNDVLPTDGDMYAQIIPEAMRLREDGILLAEFQRIKCPVMLIQGAVDSHPYTGVTEPLFGSGIELKTQILEKCGHTPWKERHAQTLFFRILFEEISEC